VVAALTVTMAVVVVVVVSVSVAEEVTVSVSVAVTVVVADGTTVEVEVAVEVAVAVTVDPGSVTVWVGAQYVEYTVNTVSSVLVHSTCCGCQSPAAGGCSVPAVDLALAGKVTYPRSAANCRALSTRLRPFFFDAGAFCSPVESVMPT
jgi:hypothetical protein